MRQSPGALAPAPRPIPMIAVDTNVLVRFVTNDEPAQARRAASLFEAHEIRIPKTVLLECEWVLRYAYALPREAIASAFRAVLGLPGVSVEDPNAAAQAIAWFEKGMDFADALHLASSGRVERFASFDTRLIARARRLSAVPVGAP